ncbi:MAG: CPBP family intramembrane metalloprotease, partial [Planctomycetes bacterium]|nr:CPBP family intramembrane metalloprotease [Planctomycetota bacterium]
LEALQGTLGPRDALIVSALMFMVLHVAVLSFPHLLLMGLVLGYLRMKSGSLYPCMVLHFTHNLLVILVEMGGR